MLPFSGSTLQQDPRIEYEVVCCQEKHDNKMNKTI